uniref:Vesicle tethering protein Uso1/P115-like head domain-containing protein n=1 Tax=Timema genevievae TaxID=629358 RepID=A0A7R9JXJ9_TIMGE|nr:unnamed protein product [Timema genevievae]
MEYFKSGLKSVLGASQEGVQLTGAETVERLVERVQFSTLLDDRRDACRALKALSRKYRIEVGAQGMGALRHVLETDHADSEIVGYSLDTLCNITAPETFEEEEHPNLGPTLTGVSQQFTEIFIKQPDNVALVLGFLEEYDFHVRWPAVKLLTSLLANKPKDLQEIVLVSPMGVSKLMDLLSDSREVIRNDALLLLTQLTKGNANIQKIVAFENAFDRLFDVIMEEGYSDGGIVVEDCLLLMLNLLRNNTSNQNFFKEGSYIQRLTPMFKLPQDVDDSGWSAQKVSNIHCMLQVARTLVTPGNPAQVTSSSQKSMRQCGLLEALCDILMASGVPADILTETISTVGEVIRGNQSNQEYFSTVMAPSTPPRPALVVLLMSMVNEKQPFILRCSVLYCYQCFLFKNEVGQSQLVQTLLPSATEVISLTTGQLLCGGLFSNDALSNWFSAVALSHALVENPGQQEQLLRVLLATNTGGQPVSLLHQCSMLLQQCSKLHSKLGLLILLSTWLSHCPLAVKQFVSVPTSVTYLTAQAGSNEHDDNEELVQGMCAFLLGLCIVFNDDSVAAFTKDKLKQLVGNRIGVEVFVDKLGEVSKHEVYSKAAKHPQLKPQFPSDLLLDHEFCQLFKALEGMVVKAVAPKPLMNGSSEPAVDSSYLLQYKELIREQDRRLEELSQTVERLTQEKHYMQMKLEECTGTLVQLRDQNMLLKAQANTSLGPVPELEEARVGLEHWRAECEHKDAIIESLQSNISADTHTDDLEARLHELYLEMGEKDLELERLKKSTTSHQHQDTSDELVETRQRLSEVSAELDKMKRDQDDLLELLTDQDTRLSMFKERLRTLGEKKTRSQANVSSSTHFKNKNMILLEGSL